MTRKLNLFTIGVGLSLSSCGAVKREVASLTGVPSEYCHLGVTYLQFPSGAVVAVDPLGKPLACSKGGRK